MPCSILIAARDLNPTHPKGYISKAVHDHPWTPGGLEALPDWAVIEIIDASADIVRTYTESWYLHYEVTEIPTPPKIRLQFVVHPSVISLSGIGGDVISTKMLNWALDVFAGDSVNSSVNHMLIDFPNPLINLGTGEVATVDELIADFHDRNAEMFDASSHYIADADVDTIVAPPLNGTISMTLEIFQTAWVKAKLND